MSYILDALRKSEHERRVGTVPTLENTPFNNPERSSQKPWTIILVAILICLNVGILLVITVFDREDSTPHIGAADEAPDDAGKARISLGQPKLVLNQDSATQPSTMSTPEKDRRPQSKTPPPLRPITKTAALPTARIPSATRPSSKTAAKHSVRPTVVANRTSNQNQPNAVKPSKFSSNSQPTTKKPPLPAPTSPQAQPNLIASPPPQPQKSKLPADGNRKTVTESAITLPKPTAVAATPQQPKSVSTSGTDRKTLIKLPAPEPKSSVATATPMAPSSQSKHLNAHRAAVQPKPPATESRNGSIPLLSNMSRDFQRQIPDMNINVFVYSEAPEERFVIINMVKYKNGQKLRDGPLLGEIRSDSVVLNYRGRDFRLSRP